MNSSVACWESDETESDASWPSRETSSSSHSGYYPITWDEEGDVDESRNAAEGLETIGTPRITEDAVANYLDSLEAKVPWFLSFPQALKDAIPTICSSQSEGRSHHQSNLHHRPDTLLHAGRLVGPVLPSLSISTSLKGLSQILVFVLTFRTTRCVDGLAKHPPVWSTVIIIAIMVVIMLYRNYAEWNAFRHYLISYLKKFPTKDPTFKIMGKKVSLKTWFILYMAVSNIVVLDLRSDAIFAGVAVSSCSCGGNKYEELWSTAWRQSSYKILPDPGLSTLVKCAFFISLVQFVSPVVRTGRHALKTCGQSKEFEYGHEGNDRVCWTGREINNEDALTGLATAADLATVCNLSTLNVKHRIKIARGQEPNARGEFVEDFRHTHLIGAVSLGDQLLERVIFMWMLEHVVQINLQTTFFAISYHLHRRMNLVLFQNVCSLILGIVSSLANLVFSQKVVVICENALEGADDKAEHVHETEKGECEMRAAATRLRRILLTLRIFRVILVMALTYGACKFCAVFICKDSLWNITGCVDLSK